MGFVLRDVGFLGAVSSLGYMSVGVVSFQVKNGYVGGSMSCIYQVVVSWFREVAKHVPAEAWPSTLAVQAVFSKTGYVVRRVFLVVHFLMGIIILRNNMFFKGLRVNLRSILYNPTIERSVDSTCGRWYFFSSLSPTAQSADKLFMRVLFSNPSPNKSDPYPQLSVIGTLAGHKYPVFPLLAGQWLSVLSRKLPYLSP